MRATDNMRSYVHADGHAHTAGGGDQETDDSTAAAARRLLGVLFETAEGFVGTTAAVVDSSGVRFAHELVYWAVVAALAVRVCRVGA
ncbi:MAG: hypothetical protein CMI16_07335 [Opitutaceae bacterium]|nr:hypothetical protein [Opitutaceae bacterium]